MHYSNRWWYVAALVISMVLIVYFFLIQPEQMDLENTLQEKTQLTERLISIKQFAEQQNGDSVPATKASETDLFAMLSVLANQKQVRIKAIRLMAGTVEVVGAFTIRLNAEGGFEQLSQFALALMAQSPPVFILNFSYRAVTTQNLQLEMELLMTMNSVALFSKKSIKIPHFQSHNPFCMPSNTNFQATNVDAAMLQTIPLQQISMTGYMEQGSRRMALLTLPTGAVMPVKKGMEIGREKAKIVTMQENGITVETNHQPITIRMQP